jgi:hypothetical protein
VDTIIEPLFRQLSPTATSMPGGRQRRDTLLGKGKTEAIVVIAAVALGLVATLAVILINPRHHALYHVE